MTETRARYTIPAKVHVVTVDGTRYYVMATTKAGAIRNVTAHRRSLETVTCEVASGRDLYLAGAQGETVLGLSQEPIPACVDTPA